MDMTTLLAAIDEEIKKLEKRAGELGCDLDVPFITNYSRLMKKTAEYSPDFAYNMQRRRDVCNTYNVSVSLNNEMVKAASLIDKLVIEKEKTEPVAMVSAISEFDKLAKLEYYYDDRIADPIFTVFGSTDKPDYDIEKIAGVSTRGLKKAAKNPAFMKKISSIMDSKFVDSFTKDSVGTFKTASSVEQQLVKAQM